MNGVKHSVAFLMAILLLVGCVTGCVSAYENTVSTCSTQATEFVKDAPMMVWIPTYGEKFHSRFDCCGMIEPSYVSIEEAYELGYTPCKHCFE